MNEYLNHNEIKRESYEKYKQTSAIKNFTPIGGHLALILARNLRFLRVVKVANNSYHLLQHMFEFLPVDFLIM